MPAQETVPHSMKKFGSNTANSKKINDYFEPATSPARNSYQHSDRIVMSPTGLATGVSVFNLTCCFWLQISYFFEPIKDQLSFWLHRWCVRMLIYVAGFFTMFKPKFFHITPFWFLVSKLIGHKYLQSACCSHLWMLFKCHTTKLVVTCGFNSVLWVSSSNINPVVLTVACFSWLVGANFFFCELGSVYHLCEQIWDICCFAVTGFPIIPPR